MRALVLGASGFLGRWIARVLAEEGAELFVAARDPLALSAVQRTYDFAGEAHPLDLDDVAGLLAHARPDVIFNAVGYGVARAEREEAEARRVNADFVERLARAVTPEQVLIHAGSALEYGVIGGDLNEASTPAPTTLYGRTKLEGTERLRAIAADRGLRALTARLFTIYGPGEHEGRLLPTLLAAAESDQPLDFTAGEQRRDFTYVEEAARASIALARTDGVRPGDVVNVATGRLTSVREFIESAVRVLSIPSGRVRLGALPARPEEMSHDDVSISYLRALIGWTPELTPEEGIRRTVRFHQSGRS